jgi:hypothetical protein
VKLEFRIYGEKEKFRKRNDKNGGKLGENGRNMIF